MNKYYFGTYKYATSMNNIDFFLFKTKNIIKALNFGYITVVFSSKTREPVT